jgi:hypothetical protein
LRISRSATVPGLYLCGFFTPPVVGADFLAACNETTTAAASQNKTLQKRITDRNET